MKATSHFLRSHTRGEKEESNSEQATKYHSDEISVGTLMVTIGLDDWRDYNTTATVQGHEINQTDFIL